MAKKFFKTFDRINPYIFVPSLLVIHTLLIRSFGRSLICWCGKISLFVYDSNSREGSQQLTDFYTFSHIIHGFIFYAFLFKFARKVSLKSRLLIAVLIETAWELVENTPMVINHYRNGTVSDTYNGDSVINSLMDIFAMMLGFYLARKFPVWISITLIILMEVIVGYLIHDNLTLNIIMLFCPVKFIQMWQSGA